MAKGPCISFKKGVETKDKGVYEQEWKDEESAHLKCMEGRTGCPCAGQPGQSRPYLIVATALLLSEEGLEWEEECLTTEKLD